MITSAELDAYCANKPQTSKDYPFDEKTAVWRVAKKLFALYDDTATGIITNLNLKCDPDWALALREIYPEGVLPGYHMNKRYWNTVVLDGRVPFDEVWEMIDHSYRQVVQGLPKKDRPMGM